jgi:predicted transposase YdaD
VSKFKELVTEEQQEQVMTVANRFREEGKLQGTEQGLEKSKLKIAKNLLTKNLDEVLIAETICLTLSET